jgi:hypothetical protein
MPALQWKTSRTLPKTALDYNSMPLPAIAVLFSKACHNHFTADEFVTDAKMNFLKVID